MTRTIFRILRPERTMIVFTSYTFFAGLSIRILKIFQIFLQHFLTLIKTFFTTKKAAPPAFLPTERPLSVFTHPCKVKPGKITDATICSCSHQFRMGSDLSNADNKSSTVLSGVPNPRHTVFHYDAL